MALPDFDVYTAELVNSSIGSANPAFVSFTFGGTTLFSANPVTLATNVCAFLARCSMAVGTSITTVRRRRSIDMGSTAIAFGASYYAALKAVDGSLPTMGAYGADVGGGPLLPRGSSTLIIEQTETPGRAATGRVNIPYLPQGAINSTGEISTAVRVAVAGVYGTYIIRDGTNSAVLPVGFDPGPLVISKSTSTAHSVRLAIVSPLPSRLRSRQR